MSLHDVQEASSGTWKAAVVGAYERGDRNVTVAKLSELADFYGVPVTEVLPEDEFVPTAVHERRRRFVLDLTSMTGMADGDRAPLERFIAAIQLQRGDFNGRVLSIRENDLLALALLYETTAPEVSDRLEDWGLLADGSP
jgi:transcriptional regulator with XRE-family HTH domain